jgi:hypothetical protein
MNEFFVQDFENLFDQLKDLFECLIIAGMDEIEWG